MASSASATVRVEKATSNLLTGPDLTMNIDICDFINSNYGQEKDVVKAVKKRLQHKNPKVQLLALTLLETMVKNCGENIHFQIVERNILQEMVKIVRKKPDIHVRDKTLLLLDSWQAAFGGAGGKYPQYYWAYADVWRTGVQFPQQASDAAPIFTPPISHPSTGKPHVANRIPLNHNRFEETMAPALESLRLQEEKKNHNHMGPDTTNSTMDVMELLRNKLQSLNPSNRMAVKDDVIVVLVDRCRSNQKKLKQMLLSTRDEELLSIGLELNDNLQNLLAMHDAIASGLPISTQATSFSPKPTVVASSFEACEGLRFGEGTNTIPSAPFEEEEGDDFAQIVRRHFRPKTEGSLFARADSNSFASNTATVLYPPAPVTTTKEQDIFYLLGINLSTTPTLPNNLIASHKTPDVPVSSPTQGYPHAPQTYLGNQGQVSCDRYVVPLVHPPSEARPQHTETSSSYPPPPWASNSGCANNQSLSTTLTSSSPQSSITQSYIPMQRARVLQSYNTFSVSSSSSNVGPSTGKNPFIPSYRLFDDLDVFGKSTDSRVNVRNSASPNLSGTSGPSMVGGPK